MAGALGFGRNGPRAGQSRVGPSGEVACWAERVSEPGRAEGEARAGKGVGRAVQLGWGGSAREVGRGGALGWLGEARLGFLSSFLFPFEFLIK
jgi:hypothetical protein